MPTKTPFADIPTAIEEMRAGRMIVVVDDEDRENEGDLTMAAEMKLSPSSSAGLTTEVAFARTVISAVRRRVAASVRVVAGPP